VYAVPGSTGRNADFDQIGPALAREGVVVFATDYRSDSSDEELTRELECGYRYVRSVAGTYGGDLGQPVTVVGYSRGARAVWSGLDARRFGPGGSYHGCFRGAARPDVVAAIDGCYYAFAGWTHPFPVARLGIGDARLLLVSGEADDVCPTWESRRAARALRAAGHDTTLVRIPKANHHTVRVVDAAAGRQTVRAILDAIRAAQEGRLRQ
jgi:acetyl esterase/lipase